MDAESILTGLNPDQRAAVLHDHKRDGQLLILAGAGSGKTSVLTKRIQYRIASGVKPEKILALTFTAKAAAEMRERVQKLFPDAGVRLCTFHSLALFMLKQKIDGMYAYEMVGMKKMPSPQESAGKDFMKQLVKMKLPAGKLNRENLFDDRQPKAIAGKLDGLRRPVLETGQVVFEDLIYLAIQLLEKNERARGFFQDMWEEIMVDEYQDINPSQYRMVKALLGDRPSLFVVGDDDQAIYGFRGADIGNINRFCEDFKNSTLIRLEWNYRSVSNVLHLANGIFDKKPLKLRKVLRAGNPNGSGGNPLFKENRTPEVWVSENPVEEMDKIIYRIKDLRDAYDLEWKNFAILVRYNRQRLYYVEALRNAGLPVAGTELEPELLVENGIHVETVHASKGLQYAVVFYAGLAEKLTPGECTGSRKERKRQMEEERRLYYVGVTRAEAHLHLLYCKNRYWKGRLVHLKPSRFLPPQKKTEISMPLILFRIYVVLIVLGYMLLHILLLPLMNLFKKSEVDAWIDMKIQRFAGFCMRMLRVDLSLENQALLGRVDWNRPVFVMGNHASYADIPVVFLAVQRRVGFIAKKELSMIPFLSFWIRKIGCISVDRQKGGGADLIRKVMSDRETPPRIFVFPEGTRSKTGEILPFKSGCFRLAMETGAIILPVALTGTAAVWEKRTSSKGTKVSAKILEPIDVAEMMKANPDLDPKKDLMPMVRQMIVEAV